MPFTYPRTVRLSDTDAAGVAYFAKVLSMCHEAYEDSLIEAGIDLKTFLNNSSTAIPIVHAQIDFFRPLLCGDKLLIHLAPQQLSENKFEITYQIFTVSSSQKPRAKANTRHVCINPTSRSRTSLPEAIIQWLTLP